MESNILKAIIWKETKYLHRSSLWIIVIYLLIILFGMQLFIASEYCKSNMTDDMINKMLVGNIMFLPALVITMVGGFLLQQSINQERQERTLEILLAMGIRQKTLWYAKFIFTIMLSYFIWGIFFIFYIFGIFKICNIRFSLNIEEQIFMWLISPLIAIAVLSVLSLLNWTLKQGYIQMLVAVIPMLSLTGAITLLDYCSKHHIKISMLFAITIFIFATLIVFCAGKIMDYVSKDYLVNL